MDWREEYKRKLTSAEEAAKVVKSGDRVVFPMAQSPQVLHEALGARKDELRGVEVLQGVVGIAYPWYQPGYEEAFTANFGQYIGPLPRQMMWERRGDFTATPYAIEFKDLDDRRPGCIDPDVVIVVVSPPDEHGFCSFGESIWEKKQYVKRAKKVIAEVNEHLIRTYGDNFVHVSEIDYFVEATPYDPTPEELEQAIARIPPESREKMKALFDEFKVPGYAIWATRDILSILTPSLADMLERTVYGAGPIPEHCYGIAHHVNQLMKDGDCIQIGSGATSNPLVRAGVFDGKQDLGFHTEVSPPLIPTLVKEGLFTGKYKTLHHGKATGTSYWPSSSMRQDELDFLNENPLFELYGADYTNNVRVISANDNVLSIQNAMFVDFTGQIGVETLPGFLLQNGPGGQMDFVIGALNSKGGRSVIVMPSTAVGGGVSRIVPLMEEGVMVTVPRTYADLIVTEYGIASLMGKSLRRRAEELISIAHPDFRAELRKEAQKLFWP